MKFYVYHLISSLDQKVFYVGKGKDRRMYVHAAIATKKDYQNHLYNKIRKILKDGGSILYTKVFETDSEQEAFNFEIKEISRIGRSSLCNCTDGGEGFSGGSFKQSDYQKRVVSFNFKGKSKTEEHRKKLSEAKLRNPVRYWKGKKFTEDHKKKLSEVERNISEEQIVRSTKQIVNYIKSIKGKTVEEIYGVEKGAEIRKKNGLANLGRKYSKEVNLKKGRPGIDRWVNARKRKQEKYHENS